MLLRFETVHVDRQFGGRQNWGRENKFPAGELRAVAKIEIFAKRIVLPAARFFDAGLSPKSGGAIEIEKSSTAAARGLFEDKMAVQKHRLNPREQRVTAIQMAPTRLDHANLRVGEEMDRALQQILRSDEIRIQDANEVARGRFKSNRQGAGFESGPIDPMNQLHIEAALPQLNRASSRHFARIVG